MDIAATADTADTATTTRRRPELAEGRAGSRAKPPAKDPYEPLSAIM